jgi:hypothetical protein
MTELKPNFQFRDYVVDGDVEDFREWPANGMANPNAHSFGVEIEDPPYQRYLYDDRLQMHTYRGYKISDAQIKQAMKPDEPLRDTLDRIVGGFNSPPLNTFQQTFRTNGEKLEADEDEMLAQWDQWTARSTARPKPNDEGVLEYLARKARENSGRG